MALHPDQAEEFVDAMLKANKPFFVEFARGLLASGQKSSPLSIKKSQTKVPSPENLQEHDIAPQPPRIVELQMPDGRKFKVLKVDKFDDLEDY